MCVSLSSFGCSYHTAGVPPDGLCTVEAVYFLCREVRSLSSAVPTQLLTLACRKLHTNAEHSDCHCFDDLLWCVRYLPCAQRSCLTSVLNRYFAHQHKTVMRGNALRAASQLGAAETGE